MINFVFDTWETSCPFRKSKEQVFSLLIFSNMADIIGMPYGWQKYVANGDHANDLNFT